MKLIQIALSIMSISTLASCANMESNPIKMATTRIVLSEHTNSGLAIHTSYDLTSDSLVWEYDEGRNSCHLTDVSKGCNKDFNELLRKLATIKFSVKDSHDYSVGGSGWGIFFENEGDRYLYYNDKFILSGDYQKVSETLREYIQNHQPEGLKIFKQCQAEPHERPMYGEFEQLPKTLEKYSVQ